uniref:Uncharacterized protein n=1 Tax=Rhizophora mucronata TaxID=61149 RepID=A0A2P2JBH2_RHIMU
MRFFISLDFPSIWFFEAARYSTKEGWI